MIDGQQEEQNKMEKQMSLMGILKGLKVEVGIEPTSEKKDKIGNLDFH